jgi:hypothetical protein
MNIFKAVYFNLYSIKFFKFPFLNSSNFLKILILQIFSYASYQFDWWRLLAANTIWSLLFYAKNWIPLRSYCSISFLKFQLITFFYTVNLFSLKFGISKNIEVVMYTQSKNSRLMCKWGGIYLFFSSISSSRDLSAYFWWELTP